MAVGVNMRGAARSPLVIGVSWTTEGRLALQEAKQTDVERTTPGRSARSGPGTA